MTRWLLLAVTTTRPTVLARGHHLTDVSRSGVFNVARGSTGAMDEQPRSGDSYYVDGTTHWSCPVGTGGPPSVTVTERLTPFDGDTVRSSSLAWATPLT